MSKTPKKSAKSAAKKPTMKAKPKMKASVKPMANAKGSRRGFMWKMLEQKEQKQKELATIGKPNVNPDDRVHATATKNGFARFNGPRRRVG